MSKIIAGDFDGYSLVTNFGQLFLSKSFGDTIDLKGNLERVELVTEENKKKILGSTAWGVTGLVVGGLIAAPVAIVAGIAGLLKGGRKKEVCIAVYLKNGKKFMVITDHKIYQKFLSLTF
jgi:hypothetical protein